MKRFIFVLALFSLLSSSCSVMMASHKGGTNIESIQTISSRAQLIALGAESLSSEKNEMGEKIETFKILREKGSIARAFMHGMLDLSTLFLWEIAGTPIESVLSQKKYFSLKVTLDRNDTIKKVELM
jgi:hypothetical protein